MKGIKWIILTFFLPITVLASDKWTNEVIRFSNSIKKELPASQKLALVSHWVTQEFSKLRPDPVKDPAGSLEFGEYELVLLDLIENLKNPSPLEASTETKIQFDCEYFLLHWQINLQPQGETLENSTIKTLKPLIQKFCP
jgi:hypothetical protein